MPGGSRPGRRGGACAPLAALLLLLPLLLPAAAAHAGSPRLLLVVGSVNMDLTVDVQRLPAKHETLSAAAAAPTRALGGKGANQAVAAARLSASGQASRVRLVARLGSDAHGDELAAQLERAGLDVSGCVREPTSSGLGIVLLEPDGAASSVVLGGANAAWPEGEDLSHLLTPGTGVVLLQREVPAHVNLAVARAAAAASVPVLLDGGGEDRPLPDELLGLLEWVAPNEHELQLLTGLPTHNEEQVVAAALSLTHRGAANVLVTLAERGALLVSADGSVMRQPGLPVPGGAVVDGTAAGDAFRAGFAVGQLEGWPLQACLQFAAAAGAIAVSRRGALPSLPTRDEVLQLLGSAEQQDTQTAAWLAQLAGAAAEAPATPAAAQPAGCPFQFASRLNSMRMRRDLVTDPARTPDNLLGWIARQGTINGLSRVDLNWPPHFAGVSVQQVARWIADAGLEPGAINVRFPLHTGLASPSASLRADALELGVQACDVAAELGARQVVVWSQYDGFDYPLQLDYAAAWRDTAEAFRALGTACARHGVRVSLEAKPTDPATRFSVVPNTASALLLVQEVGLANVGVTLDVGHMLAAGEHLAQSVALAGRHLFGLHLNDAPRLGAEDGLVFASWSPAAALDLLRQLQRMADDGVVRLSSLHVCFDTFPAREDPVREAELNIRRVHALWAKAARLGPALDAAAQQQDALAVLELLDADEAAAGGGAAAAAQECAAGGGPASS